MTPVPPKKGLPPSIGGPANPDVTPRAIFSGLTPRGLGSRSSAPRVEKVLSIRVDFEDQPMDSSQAYIERLVYFQRQYYEAVSGGRLILEHTVTPRVYRMPRPMSYYGDDDSIGVRQSLLAWDAVQAADPDVQFSDYDQVLIFHGGAGQESDVKDDSREQIWSVFFRPLDFSFYLPRPGAARGIATSERTASGDTVFVPSVGIFPETESQDGYVFSAVGVVCHEFGHSLGLPDLYDTVAPDNQVFAESQGVGNWDIMGSGTWNANGFSPAEFSAWSKIFLGWIEPVVVDRNASISLRAVERDRNHGVVKVPMGGDEYLLLENRLQDVNMDGRYNFDEQDSTSCGWHTQGSDSVFVCPFDMYKDSYAGAEWDWWLPGEGKGSGLLIWHIDDSVIRDNLEFNTVNADPNHKGVDVEEADGIQDLDTPAQDVLSFGSPHDVYRAGWVDRFAPDTEPNTDAYYGIRTGITIDQVSQPDTVMTFRVSFGNSGGGWPVDTAGPFAGNHVAVANVDEVADREIIVTDQAGELFVLKADGTPAWPSDGHKVFHHFSRPVGAPLAADINGDGVDDVLVMDRDGWVWGFQGGSGIPLGRSPDGRLLQSPNPMPGVSLWAFDMDRNLPGMEFGFGGAADTTGPSRGLSRISMYTVTSDGRVLERGAASLHGGSGALPSIVLDVEKDGHLELLSTARDSSRTRPRGSVELQVLDYLPGSTIPFLAGASAIAPLPDTVCYSAPVVGDLDRDGKLDAVVTSSDSLIYALGLEVSGGQPKITIKPGWPRKVYASGDDAVSLADVDGNGYPEILVLETSGVIHILNYHGEQLVSLPRQLPSETRYFLEPQLAPLVCDLTGDGKPEIVAPLSDGQVFGLRTDGSRLGSWNYFGSGRPAASPAVEDLRGDGQIELITVSPHLDGGRIDVHTIGQAAGPPLWGSVRHTAANDGLVIPRDNERVVNGSTLRDLFAMPNPARSAVRFHYRVGEGVTSVRARVVDLLGREVQVLAGTSFAGTDNLIGWDLTGADGRSVGPGVYLVQLEALGTGQNQLARGTIKLAVVK